MPAFVSLERRHFDPALAGRVKASRPSTGIQVAFCSCTSRRRVSTSASVTGSTRRCSVKPPVRLELDLGTDLDMELEFDRPAGLELEIVDVRLGDRLELLAGLGRFPALPDHLFQHGLPDGVTEPLANHPLGGVSLPEAGQAGPLPVVLERLVLRLAHPVHRDRHLERLGGFVFLGLYDRYVRHGRQFSLPQGEGAVGAAARSDADRDGAKTRV